MSVSTISCDIIIPSVFLFAGFWMRFFKTVITFLLSFGFSPSVVLSVWYGLMGKV
ncbi:hypothetical protein PPACK8108_LOCUS5963 [Phakopsora pachyrhizi]|uniref:Uncharacterized protein n=1 Tax=Phakopsora pachyrhizi TaxID=170000 RepID=A0AAV0APV5_PHAPC|nr:hypothetical protein PPACK8108_LOCUS5963 [Phakopsora pachyrhizi]